MGSAPTMLLTFRAGNVRSFRDSMELSFVATALAEKEAIRIIPWNQAGSTVKVLPVACVFGANASGKSNVLRAMADMRHVVLASFRSWSTIKGTRRRPFRLDKESLTKPSRFEVDLVLSGVRHEFGFALDDEVVTEEWLSRYPKGKAALVFRRERQKVTWGSSIPGRYRQITDLLRPNALLLSTAAAAGHPDLTPLFEWFTRNLRLAEASSREHRYAFAVEMLTQDQSKTQMLALLRAADLGISGVTKAELDPEILQKVERIAQILTEDDDEERPPSTGGVLQLADVRLHHEGIDGPVEFSTGEESMGTLIWLGLVGPLVDALAHGSVLLADELDASLHPALSAQVVRLFQDPETNPRRAQIVFNSHDTSLLGDHAGNRILGRDQIWFAEKNNAGSTRLYALSDMDPRKGEAVGRRYLDGRYGATPIISDGDFDSAADLITSGVE